MALELEGGHPDMDYVEHQRTYLLFLSFIKWGIGFLVVLLLGMAYFLV